jgi:hypothetical protein
LAIAFDKVGAMSLKRIDDPQAFREFLDAQLADGGANLTLDEVLALWECENQTEAERAETLAAIREGLADVEAGRVRPAREAIAELRRKYNLPELP